MAKKSRKRHGEEQDLSPLGLLLVIILVSIYGFVSGVVSWITSHPFETAGIVAVVLTVLSLLFYMLYKKFKFNVLSWFYGGLKSLWDVYVLKKQVSADVPTQKQSMDRLSGGSVAKLFQAGRDINMYPEKQTPKGEFNIFKNAYMPLYDEMLSVIQDVEAFNEKIKFNALDNIYGKTAWTLMEPRFVGKFNEFLSLKRAYEEAYTDGLNKFVATVRAYLKNVLSDTVLKNGKKYQIQGSRDCGDAHNLFNFVLHSKKQDFLKRLLLNTPDSSVYTQFNLFANTYIATKADFSNRCEQSFDAFKGSQESNEIISKQSELLNFLHNLRQELSDFLKTNV